MCVSGEGKHRKPERGLPMYINEQTAHLILDALYWSNKEWTDALSDEEGDIWAWSDDEHLATARNDFVRFCDARGIDGVEREVG